MYLRTTILLLLALSCVRAQGCLTAIAVLAPAEAVEQLREGTLAALRTRDPRIEDLKVERDPILRNLYQAYVLRGGRWVAAGSMHMVVDGTRCEKRNTETPREFRRAGIQRLLLAEVLRANPEVRVITSRLGSDNLGAFLVALAHRPRHEEMPELIERYRDSRTYRMDTQRAVFRILNGPMTTELQERIGDAVTRQTRAGTLNTEFGFSVDAINIVRDADHLGTSAAFDIDIVSTLGSLSSAPRITFRAPPRETDDD